MATNRSTFVEVAEEIQTTNENNEVPQQAQATNKYNTVAVTQVACQGDTTEREGDVDQARNLNESDGVMAFIGDCLQSWVFDILRQLRSHPVSQGSYKDADENIRDSKVIYRSVIQRYTKTPYTFKFHDPAHIITGIACIPKDTETSSPEVEIVRGGVGSKEVEILLKPVGKGKWCCRVQINGIEDNRPQMDSTSYNTLAM